jgi:Tfp pilus assembly protein PilF
MEDILKLQDEIATVVGKQLKIKLVPFKEKQSLTGKKQEVYDLILHGNYFLDKRDRESQSKAMDLYQQALRLDSTNAASWSSLAKCYTLQSTWDWIDHRTGYLSAEAAANKALQIDPQNAVAFRTLGSVYMYRFKWKESQHYFDRALELEPGYADALRLKGLLFWATGRYGAAKELLLKSIDLDPLKPITYLNLGLVYYHNGEYKQAIASFKKALDIDPRFPRVRGMSATVYITMGEYKLAQEMTEAEGEGVLGKAVLHTALENKPESDAYLKQLIEQSSQKPFRVARVYALRGEKDKVFEWLEKAFQVGDPNLIFFKNNPFLKKYKDDPRYKSFEKKMNLPTE